MSTEHDVRTRLERDIRFEIISKTLTDPTWTAERAAEVLNLTVRQVFRLRAKIKSQGRAGLIHGNAGRRPAVALSDSLHQRVLDIYKNDFAAHDYNYSHFVHDLTDDYHITISRETARQWLRAAGFGHKLKRYLKHRLKRERRARKGQLMFLDGSPHRWFGRGGPKTTLLLATDDATGEPLYGLLRPQETRDGCFEVFYHVARKFGLPEALYLDRGSVFKTTRQGGVHAQQLSADLTAFQIAMRKLGVEIIFAYSPQARGRGERMNGSFQRRLVAEFSRHGINTIEAADSYINTRFIPRFCRYFGVIPRDPNPAFRPVPAGIDLHNILCKETRRRIQSDNTIRLNGRLYQLYPPATCPVLYGAEITVQEWFDGMIHIYYGPYGEIANRLVPATEVYQLRNRLRRRERDDKITLP